MRRRSAIAIGAAALVLVGLIVGPNLTASTRADAQHASHAGSYTWSEDFPWFLGMSAIEMSPDGRSALILGDRGLRFTAQITRDNGQITAAEITGRAVLRDSDGAPLPRKMRDSEGLATMPDGGVCVSFERTTGGNNIVVRCYARMRGPGTSLPDLPVRLPLNKGIEALASDDQGNLYAIPETSQDDDGSIPIYKYESGAWYTLFRLQDRGAFKPVGADILGSDLYLLERAVIGIGFSTRLSRISLESRTAQTLLTTGPGAHDNLEGVSVWRDAQGRLVATMISDDNDNWFQRTEVVEYILDE